jgi:hypothetical protein
MVSIYLLITNSVAIWPQVTYADQATYADRATVGTGEFNSDFCGSWVFSSTGSSRPLISVFYTGAAFSMIKYLVNYPNEAEYTPFHNHYLSENLVAPGVETRNLCICCREL